MAARRYEISLRVLKNYILFFRTRSGLVMFFLLYKRQCNTNFFSIYFHCERRDLLCSHSNGDIFTCEDITFRAKAYLVFHWCLYNKIVYVSSRKNTLTC